MNIKGILPLLILQVISRQPSYGYQIIQDIQAMSENILQYNEGALYPVLYQLEKDGLVVSYTETANGRLRKFYTLTDQGKAQLAEERAQWSSMSHGVNLILGSAAT